MGGRYFREPFPHPNPPPQGGREQARMEHAYIHGTDATEQERLAALNALTNEPFLRFLDLKVTDTVLEVGSGLGILAGEAAQRVPLGEVCGIEHSGAQLARAPRDVANLRFL